MERNSRWAMNSDGNIDFELPGVREAEIHFRGNLDDIEVAILGRAWFRRCWVLSEVIASKNLSVQSGGRKISWDDFVKVILQTPREQSQYFWRRQSWAMKVETIKFMDHARSIFHPVEHGSGSDILDLLVQSRNFGAQSFDPRDRVFAFMGIASCNPPMGENEFTINYADSCAEVYTNFAKWFIDFDQSYDLLSYAEKGLNDHEIKLFGKKESVYSYVGSDQTRMQIQLPSWAPNWVSNISNKYFRVSVGS